MDVYEADSTQRRLIELAVKPDRGNFDSAHLQSIHRYIFQDVYDWAGQFRTVNISKGGNLFGSAQFIEMALGGILEKLPQENFLQSLDRESFTSRCGWYFGEINAIHPFREGNGRTQREFLRQLAAQAGYSLDWRHVDRDTMTAASRLSFSSGDNHSMIEIIRACTR
ncbi:MAG: Fic family protein [Acidobacteria bacterium]|nr:Fic family protein [Acidobacteriota bacterium]